MQGIRGVQPVDKCSEVILNVFWKTPEVLPNNIIRHTLCGLTDSKSVFCCSRSTLVSCPHSVIIITVHLKRTLRIVVMYRLITGFGRCNNWIAHGNFVFVLPKDSIVLVSIDVCLNRLSVQDIQGALRLLVSFGRHLGCNLEG